MTVSPSTSALVAVAVSVSFVPGELVFRATVAVGAVLATVTGLEVTGAEFAEPSLAVTRTRIRSPRLPLPPFAVWDRSSVDEVAPVMSVPFLDHW